MVPVDKVLEQLAASKKNNVWFLIALGVFLGIQYTEFKSKLTRIEDRLTTLEHQKP